MGIFSFWPRRGRSDSFSRGAGLVQGGTWGNPTNGLELPGQDPTAQLLFSRGTIPSSHLVDRLYQHDWLAERVIEKMPSVAMVRGVGIEGSKDDGATLLEEFEALNTTERFQPVGCFERAVYDARGYGSTVMLLGYKKGNPQMELTDAHRAGGIAWFDVFRQNELRVLARVTDPSRADFGMPLLYEVIATGSGTGEPHPRVGQRFHASRSIRFAGKPLRTFNTSIELNDATGAHSHPELGVSVLTPLLSVMAHFGLAWNSVSNMLQDASIGWMKIGGLIESLASEEKSVIEARMQVLQMTKGSHRMFWLDADNNEEYGRTEVSLADVPAVLQMFIVLASGAADVPARIFFGTSPQGLNANSSNDGDLTQLYNTCQDYQRRYLGPKLNTILTAVNGGTPVKVTWPSLWEAGENEQAQTRLARANADNIYWQMGACEASNIVEAAKTGVHPETLGTPDDNRVVLSNGEGGGSPDPEPTAATPQGAPGKQQASKIAAKQRAEQATGKK